MHGLADGTALASPSASKAGNKVWVAHRGATIKCSGHRIRATLPEEVIPWDDPVRALPDGLAAITPSSAQGSAVPGSARGPDPRQHHFLRHDHGSGSAAEAQARRNPGYPICDAGGVHTRRCSATPWRNRITYQFRTTKWTTLWTRSLAKNYQNPIWDQDHYRNANHYYVNNDATNHNKHTIGNHVDYHMVQHHHRSHGGHRLSRARAMWRRWTHPTRTVQTRRRSSWPGSDRSSLGSAARQKTWLGTSRVHTSSRARSSLCGHIDTMKLTSSR